MKTDVGDEQSSIITALGTEYRYVCTRKSPSDAFTNKSAAQMESGSTWQRLESNWYRTVIGGVWNVLGLLLVGSSFA
jgi:hypothetical protein